MRMLRGTAAAGERLDFAGELLDLYDGDDPRRVLWRGALDRARKRLAERRYYLAVLGEFSSGKSTFINALLETELLVSDTLESTAVVVRISYGRRFTLRIDFRDGEHWEGEGPVGEGRLRPVRSPGGRADRDTGEVKRALDAMPVREVLRTATTDASVTPLIRTVHVALPSPLLASGLVIIDTPGSDSNHGYADLTRTAIADADAAVVVTQHGKILPAEQIRFLTEELDEGLRARCAFVVTRADEVEPEELDELDADARHRIADRLGIEPALAWSAPLHVVRALRPAEAHAPDRLWTDRFELTRRWLRRIAELRRPAAVTDTALKVVAGVLDELENDLGEYRTGLERRRGELAQATPADMNGLLSRWITSGLDSLAAERADLRVDLAGEAERTIAGIRERMHEAVAECPNGARVKQVLEDVVSPEVNTRLQRFLGEGGTAVNERVTGRLDTALGDLQAAFELAFDVLRRIEDGARSEPLVPGTPRAEPAPHTQSRDLGTTEAFLAADRRRDMASLGGGAGVGALIGSFLFPGVGTVVGGLVGGLLGGVLFARDMRTVRAEAVRRAMVPVEEAVTSVADHLLAATDDLTDRAGEELRGRADWYRDTYSGAVDRLHRAHRAEQRSLRDRARVLAEGQAAASEHAAGVRDDRARLRHTAALTTTDPFGGFDD